MLVSPTRPITPESSWVPCRLPKPMRHPIGFFFPLPYTQVPLYMNSFFFPSPHTQMQLCGSRFFFLRRTHKYRSIVMVFFFLRRRVWVWALCWVEVL